MPKPYIGRKTGFLLQLGGPGRNIAITFWYGKTRMMWLPDDEKILKICLFVSIEYTNGQTDKRTDRRTPHDGIRGAYA